MSRSWWIKLALLALAISVMLTGCDQVVTFRLCDENGTPLYIGTLNLDTGQAEVLVERVRYGGRFETGLAGAGGFDGNNLRGILQGDDGTQLACALAAASDGTGAGQCTGKRTFRVKLRDLPHM